LKNSKIEFFPATQWATLRVARQKISEMGLDGQVVCIHGTKGEEFSTQFESDKTGDFYTDVSSKNKDERIKWKDYQNYGKEEWER
jgi:hypothetical protein